MALKEAPGLVLEAAAAAVMSAASSALDKDLRRLLKRVCALAMTSRELRRLALR